MLILHSAITAAILEFENTTKNKKEKIISSSESPFK
jgi:hypothetical protein